MSRNDKNQCPVNGCDGEWYIDIGGSQADPTKEYRSSCGHSLKRCNGCREMFALQDLDVYSWYNPYEMNYTGKVHHQFYCDDCDAEEDGYLPDDAVEGTEPDWGRYDE